jgi:hypothetical protein
MLGHDEQIGQLSWKMLQRAYASFELAGYGLIDVRHDADRDQIPRRRAMTRCANKPSLYLFRGEASWQALDFVRAPVFHGNQSLSPIGVLAKGPCR